MRPDQEQRLARLFELAVEAPPGRRAAFAREACPDDEVVRAALLRLIEQDAASVAGPRSARDPDDTLRVGDRCGPYELLEVLGEGGMGAVWRARQTEPLRREVAIKFIKAGLDSRQVLSRFEAERQVLALLSHPGIAQVYDGGTTPQGRPFFVMELVRGEPLTRYCDRQRSAVRERLELMALVCDAVQHAHQRGIVHRDLKPGNVLITEIDGRPAPKVIDFGIARALHESESADGTLTSPGQVLGSLAYMSPEQAAGLPADSRSDVYSCGVMLYELLTGERPLRQIGAPAHAQPAALAESPSTRLRRRLRETPPRTDMAELSSRARALRGDLDWISLKCLEPDPVRRYSAAAELGADLRRHLLGQPVMARPPDLAYLTGRFLRRHRAAAIAAGVALLALVIGAVGTTVGLLRAREGERRASEAGQAALGREQEALLSSRRAGAARDFLVEIFTAASPWDTRRGELTMVQLLDEAGDRLGGAFAHDPDLKADLAMVLGRTLNSLGQPRLAARNFALALDLRRSILPVTDLALVEAAIALSGAEFQGASPEQARRYHEGFSLSVAALAAHLPALSAEIVSSYRSTHTGDPADLSAALARLIPRLTDSVPPGHALQPALVHFLMNMAATRSWFLEDHATAVECLEAVVQLLEARCPAADALLLTARFELGGELIFTHEWERARAELDAVRAVISRVLPPDTLWLVITDLRSAAAAIGAGDVALGRTQADLAFAALGQRARDYSAATSSSLLHAGEALVSSGQPTAALPFLAAADVTRVVPRRLLEAALGALGPEWLAALDAVLAAAEVGDATATAAALASWRHLASSAEDAALLGACESGRWAGIAAPAVAEVLLREALVTLQPRLPVNHMLVQLLITRLATAANLQGRPADAEAMCRDMLSRGVLDDGGQVVTRAETLLQLGLALLLQGRDSEADAILQDAEVAALRQAPGVSETARAARRGLAILDARLDRRAEHLARRSREDFVERLEAPVAETWLANAAPEAAAQVARVRALAAEQDDPACITALRALDEVLEAGDPLGLALADMLHEIAEGAAPALAAALVEAEIGRLEATLPPGHRLLATLRMQLGDLLLGQGRPRDAEALAIKALKTLVAQDGVEPESAETLEARDLLSRARAAVHR